MAITERERFKLRVADLSEKDFQDQINQRLEMFGWAAYHTHDSRRSQHGFPDICAVHPDQGHLLFAELKREPFPVRINAPDGRTLKGTRRVPLKRDQARWLESLATVARLAPATVSVHLWVPSDDLAITDCLAGHNSDMTTDWIRRKDHLDELGIRVGR